MLPARTTEADGQVTFALMNIVRQKIDQKLRDALNKFHRLGEGPNVLCHSRVASGERSKFRYKVWVGQEANVKDQVRVLRDAMFKAKADARYQDVLAGLFLLKGLDDVGPQLMHIEFRGVDHHVGYSADLPQGPALGCQGRADRGVNAKGMRSSGLTEATQQHGIRGLEKDHLG